MPTTNDHFLHCQPEPMRQTLPGRRLKPPLLGVENPWHGEPAETRFRYSVPITSTDFVVMEVVSPHLPDIRGQPKLPVDGKASGYPTRSSAYLDAIPTSAPPSHPKIVGPPVPCNYR